MNRYASPRSPAIVRRLGNSQVALAARRRVNKGSLLWSMIAPETIMLVIWTGAIIFYFVIHDRVADLDYFRFMVYQEQLKDVATPLSFIWLGLALLFFLLGSQSAARMRRRPTTAAEWSDTLALRWLLIVFACVSAVAFLWIGLTFLRTGFGAMMQLAEDENVVARDLILEGSFPGGRLMSNGFIATSIFSAMMLARPRRLPLPKRQTWALIGILIFSLVYLGFVPILISGRVNFFAAAISSYVAACIVQRRFIAVHLIPVGILSMAIVWSAKQYYSLHHVSDDSVLTQSFQSFLFYIYNDLLNSVNVIGNIDGNYLYGISSTRFIYFFTFTDKIIQQQLGDSIAHAAAFTGGGEFPLLTAPYVDFGWIGLFFLAVLGFICRYSFDAARRFGEIGSIYALLFSGLVLSLHSSYITLQDPMFSVLLLLLLIRNATRGGARSRSRLKGPVKMRA